MTRPSPRRKGPRPKVKSSARVPAETQRNERQQWRPEPSTPHWRSLAARSAHPGTGACLDACSEHSASSSTSQSAATYSLQASHRASRARTRGTATQPTEPRQHASRRPAIQKLVGAEGGGWARSKHAPVNCCPLHWPPVRMLTVCDTPFSGWWGLVATWLRQVAKCRRT